MACTPARERVVEATTREGARTDVEPVPRIARSDGRACLEVDGAPFLILGLQWDCDSCFCEEEMNHLFAHAARMGAAGDRWVSLHPMRREHLEEEGKLLQLLEPGVARVVLAGHG